MSDALVRDSAVIGEFTVSKGMKKYPKLAESLQEEKDAAINRWCIKNGKKFEDITQQEKLEIMKLPLREYDDLQQQLELSTEEEPI